VGLGFAVVFDFDDVAEEDVAAGVEREGATPEERKFKGCRVSRVPECDGREFKGSRVQGFKRATKDLRF